MSSILLIIGSLIAALLFAILYALSESREKRQEEKLKTSSLVVRPSQKKANDGLEVVISISELKSIVSMGVDHNGIASKVVAAEFNGQASLKISPQDYSILKSKLSRVQSFDADYARLVKMKERAQGFEKQKDLQNAYNAYRDLVLFASSSFTMRKNFYAYDIERMRIVSKKLKMQSDYELFISSLKNNNPD